MKIKLNGHFIKNLIELLMFSFLFFRILRYSLIIKRYRHLLEISKMEKNMLMYKNIERNIDMISEFLNECQKCLYNPKRNIL